MLGLRRRNRHERVGFRLYGAATDAARQPLFYRELGVPDTLDGRYEMLALHVFLLIDRLRRDARPGPDVAQAVFDAMFADMDVNLREMGVGDLSVGKRVREMWEALHGRAAAYETPLAAGDDAALAEALARNVWRGEPPPEGSAAALAARARALRELLAAQPLAALAAGTADFSPPAPTLPAAP